MIKYTASMLENLCKKNEKLLSQGESISKEEVCLTAAAAQVLDLIEASKHIRQCRLNVSIETVDNLPRVLGFLGMKQLTEPGVSEETVIDSIIKKASAYEMFSLYNDLNEIGGFDCRISLPDGGMDLELTARNLETGVKVSINLYKAYRRSHNRKSMVTVLSSGEIVVRQNLASDIVMKELLIPLGLMD